MKNEEITITKDSRHCNVLSDGKHSSAMKVKGYNFLIKTADNMKIQSTTIQTNNNIVEGFFHRLLRFLSTKLYPCFR